MIPPTLLPGSSWRALTGRSMPGAPARDRGERALAAASISNSKARQRLLRYYFTNPTARLHVREVPVGRLRRGFAVVYPGVRVAH
jgi:hypothetical protein